MKKSPFLKNMVIGIIALIVVIGIIILLSMLGLPIWPFTILLVTTAEVLGLHWDKKFWLHCISGFVGLLVGFSQVILGIALPATPVLILFFVILILLVTLDVGKNIIVANVLCMVNLNIVLNVPGVATAENILPIFSSYVLSVLIISLLLLLLKALETKAAQKHMQSASNNKKALEVIE